MTVLFQYFRTSFIKLIQFPDFRTSRLPVQSTRYRIFCLRLLSFYESELVSRAETKEEHGGALWQMPRNLLISIRATPLISIPLPPWICDRGTGDAQGMNLGSQPHPAERTRNCISNSGFDSLPSEAKGCWLQEIYRLRKLCPRGPNFCRGSSEIQGAAVLGSAV